jgi:hypothetical protein
MTDAAYDVFISYARVDADEARAIRDKLTALGLRVFFDTEGIDTGEEFPVIIDRAVKSARCVLGLWSRRAFDGRWVRIESRIGLDQRKLVAATIDGMRPEELPAEFYNVNVESLADFHGEDSHEGWQRILRAIGKRVGRPDLAKPNNPAIASQAPRLPPHKKRMYALVSGSAAALATLLVLNPLRLGPPSVAANEGSARAADLSGAWSGTYSEAGRETRFDLEFQSAGDGRLIGHASEPDIYGLINGQNYSAQVSGEARANGAVSFTKTYGGAGGFLRTVRYDGQVSADGANISGTWDTGTLHGPFRMQRRS